MMPRFLRATAMAVVLPVVAGPIAPSPAQASQDMLIEKCSKCHDDGQGGLTRISGQRKTPEGWLMTIVRMRTLRDAKVSVAEQAELVHYLSATQGLAPSEAAPYRYALEKDPHAQEAAAENDLNAMCGRCHTLARAGLHRLTAEEWALNVELHMGQNPTIEYQSGARDRDWYDIAKNDIAPYLAKTLAFDDPAWTDWQAADKLAPDGDWVILTDIPGKGAAYGRLTISGSEGRYEVSGSYMTQSGEELPVSGKMNFYSGYEWRANVTAGDLKLRQILAINPDSGLLEGRQFFAGQDSLGGTLRGAKSGNGAVVLGTVPETAPAGSVVAQVVGADLGTSGEFAANPFGATGEVSGENGAVEISLGDGMTGSVGFYNAIDSLKVEPTFTLARVGGGGEGMPPRMPAYFKAVGYWNGPDGQPGTEDDERIGVVPATWSVADHNEAAAAMKDAEFAGNMDAASGIFTPALAGPNPARPFSTNNAGDLSVIAQAGGHKAKAQLIVTVQRFVDPPIR